MKIQTKLSIVSVCLAWTSLTLAQTSPNPLSAGQKVIYGIVKNNIVKGAEKMPEENYSFKPTPEVRSFGQLVGHVADAQYLFCSAADGEKNPSPDIEKTKTSKADLVQALKDGFSYCDKVYDGMTDAKAAQMVKFFGRESAKLTVLS
ncbi:MAG: DinB family protein, partial [Acidobacteriota bacterium]|nr:DinB family protein [Acidobacteriota bacterium]